MKIHRILFISKNNDHIKLMESVADDLSLVQIDVEPFLNFALEKTQQEAYNLVIIGNDYPEDKIIDFFKRFGQQNQWYTPTILVRSNEDDTTSYQANDFLDLPLSQQIIAEKINNLKNVTEFITRLNTKGYDSAELDGVISKVSFYKILLSSLDRYHRHGEKSFLLLISIANIYELERINGKNVTEDICQKLKNAVMDLSRQSDLLARSSESEMCLLIAHPIKDDEALFASKRFSEALRKNKSHFNTESGSATINLALISVTDGDIIFSDTI